MASINIQLFLLWIQLADVSCLDKKSRFNSSFPRVHAALYYKSAAQLAIKASIMSHFYLSDTK